ncbi:ABC transporter substrate-binding protein [Agrobacterium vitis]|uniref:ABC transporter substrate binding protein (Hemin) n=3 Tax=Rhizobiaceae TaxID=82115 RepID=B9JXJ1_ALLAM|nr:ABC transporter substrate binding protein (hemin) [Allorhizobium ampelinum S4]MCF1446454.1 hemin ABC transporter substrate-binding protein [Allorhizobium ampelinum]MUO29827.1 ABC transporter substrate-binding protein [Agrobacterium vitis]MCF1495876.1 hemin ABC transporter substrate-binding protein [Allorhizobium ampelinum]MUO42164.1 ABC transporter substrate-binding protein [Agrobacterium vitis]
MKWRCLGNLQDDTLMRPSSLLTSLALFGLVTLPPPLPWTMTPAFAADSFPQASRIVSIGGTVTEILYDLGAGERIVAVDSTSLYPAEVSSKPNVGYMRRLSAEGILAQKPDLILTEAGSGPPDALAVLAQSGVALVNIPQQPSAETVASRIRAVGAAIGKGPQAEALASQFETQLDKLKTDLAHLPAQKKRVLFVLSIANGRIMAAGKETAADAMIRLAGATNAVGDSTGYKPLSDEAVIAAAPDIILTMDHGAAPLSAKEIFALPALATSPAAQAQAFLSMDGLYLLGFGPRTADAARELASKLYPEATIQ